MAAYKWFRQKKDKKGGDKTMDILDRLQAEDGYVRLVLASGEVAFGRPDCVVYDEDDEGYDTVKLIRFEPWDGKFAKYFTAEEIASFDTCQEADIPPAE